MTETEEDLESTKFTIELNRREGLSEFSDVNGEGIETALRGILDFEMETRLINFIISKNESNEANLDRGDVTIQLRTNKKIRISDVEESLQQALGSENDNPELVISVVKTGLLNRRPSH